MAGALSLSRRGFSLIDALVALAILAIALTAAFRSLGASLLLTHESQQRQMAMWVAENQLADIRARRLWLDLGRHEGVEQQGKWTFRWVEEVKNTPHAGFRRVEVAVYGEDEATASNGAAPHALARLVGYAGQPFAL